MTTPTLSGTYSKVTDLGIQTQTPYLTFVYRGKLSISHQKLHNLITKMKYNGLGYRKISKELNRQGIKSKNAFLASSIFLIL